MSEKEFLDAVANIPAEWVCVRCKRSFDNGPFGDMPWAVDTKLDTKRGVNVVVGDVCSACYAKDDNDGT